MATFLDNTIYTNYALRKICENLVDNYSNFNFIKVKIGSGDNTLSLDREDLTTLLYSLVITTTYYEDGVLTIECQIPPELADVPITEIGLFDTVMGVDYLFSYSKVEVTKPSDIGYELTIVLNLGPKTIDFPGVNIFEIPEYEYVTQSTLDTFTDMFVYVDTNLERVIHSNAEEIGYNMAEVAYERELSIAETHRNTCFSNAYYSLYDRFDEDIADMYFLHEPKFLSYDVINYANGEGYLEVYNRLFESHNDTITFSSGAYTLLVTMKLADTTVESAILNKRSENQLYFSWELGKTDEVYKIGSDKTRFYNNYTTLNFKLFAGSSAYEVTYVLDPSDLGQYMTNYKTYALVFNGSLTNPSFQLFFDGKEIEKYDSPTEGESDEKIASRSVSDLYGKLLITEADLTKLYDYSDLSLRNCLIDYNTGVKYNYDNSQQISSIIGVKRQANEHELAFLNAVLSTLALLDT